MLPPRWSSQTSAAQILNNFFGRCFASSTPPTTSRTSSLRQVRQSIKPWQGATVYYQTLRTENVKKTNNCFFSVVTVNLTSLLVLTTLFIRSEKKCFVGGFFYGKCCSVSDSLPKTAYVKMVDIWLIFAQLVPWIEVRRFICFKMARSPL